MDVCEHGMALRRGKKRLELAWYAKLRDSSCNAKESCAPLTTDDLTMYRNDKEGRTLFPPISSKPTRSRSCRSNIGKTATHLNFLRPAETISIVQKCASCVQERLSQVFPVAHNRDVHYNSLLRPTAYSSSNHMSLPWLLPVLVLHDQAILAPWRRRRKRHWSAALVSIDSDVKHDFLWSNGHATGMVVGLCSSLTDRRCYLM